MSNLSRDCSFLPRHYYLLSPIIDCIRVQVAMELMKKMFNRKKEVSEAKGESSQKSKSRSQDLGDNSSPVLSIEANGETELATFALSCFWYPESRFGCVTGVLKTRVGYTGGKKKGPTYTSIGDHTESVEITFDPKVTNYNQMVNMFWENHNPIDSLSTQYMSAIFYHSDNQKKLAEESKKERQKLLTKDIMTKIMAAETFYIAEDYHQKYLLRQQQDILRDLKLSDADLITSTIACRLNGFCGGNGTLEQLEEELPSFKLDSQVEERLRDFFFHCPVH